jgi:hypothetical protein
LLASDLNLTGHGDALSLKYGIANSGQDGGFGFSGLDNIEGSYILPLNRYNTTLGASGSRLDTSIVEETFLDLDIASETVSYGFFLRQPFFQTANHEAAFTVAFDHRQNDTKLLGSPFNISPGAVNGRTVVSALRLSQEWIGRSQNDVLALRSTFNIGLNALGATEIGTDRDEYFFHGWPGAIHPPPVQHANQPFCLTGQWTDEPLLTGTNQCGRRRTVRPREQVVRDRVHFILNSVCGPVRQVGRGHRASRAVLRLRRRLEQGDFTKPTTIYSTGVGIFDFAQQAYQRPALGLPAHAFNSR